MQVKDLLDKLSSCDPEATLYVKDVPGSNYGLVSVTEHKVITQGQGTEDTVTVLIQ